MMALNIKNKEVENLLEEVVRLTGESKTEAVRKALEERHHRLSLRLAKGKDKRRLQAFGRGDLASDSARITGDRINERRRRRNPGIRRIGRMIVDTSAIIAILFQEPGYEILKDKLDAVEEAGIGAPTLVECGIVLSARTGEMLVVYWLVFWKKLNIVTISFTDAHFGIAVGAWQKYGKGRHPASLNFGDCLTYAVAQLANMPLLYKGADFSQTDLLSA
ncbi:MAG: type II toxin-antitoxin system VapB family antitoxin [Chloroflexi bacterium]|nr:type II toxin-antitoxin system VapB family antitoxin [Chloroflexota bacterium]